MVKSYLRYEPDGSYGVIASPSGNVIYDKSGRLAIAPALQNVIVWNIRQGTKKFVMEGEQGSQVSALVLNPTGEYLAVGYSTGVIKVFNFSNGVLEVTLDGHNSSVQTLCYTDDGTMLASGSNDTCIIVWDIMTQSGLYRLRGHKDAVTCVKFLKKNSLLVSGSKDTLLKVWDLETQHCIQTCVGHRSEVWSFDTNIDETRIASGSSDDQIRIWEISHNISNNSTDILSLLGSITRQSNDRVMKILFKSDGNLLACQGSGKTIEIYKVRTQEEIKKKLARKAKRQREKIKKKMGSSNIELENTKVDIESNVSDDYELITVLRNSHKVRSFDFSPDAAKDGTTYLMMGLQNNSIEVYKITPSAENPEDKSSRILSLVLQGHRSDIRYTTLSFDDKLLMTVSSSLVKIWNANSMQCVRTMNTSLALCGLFVPGNRHVVIGTKEGHLQLFDIGSGQCIMDNTDAHEGAIWSLDIRPDGKGIATGGADKQVKFWEFEMILQTVSDSNEISTERKRVLSLAHIRTLKMSDDILCVKYSNTKDSSKLLLAVGLLDSTVKVFYDNSLKFFLSLYGHKLPVMSMDISSDDSMLVTVSADKNIKIWGLDFGDCHKSIFAHDDSIMTVKFVKKTHYFFTASKDKSIKYWDADHFERILTLQGHFGEVWGLTVSHDGSFMMSVSHDRSICKWKRTDDQVFIEEEREKEMETMFEEELNDSRSNGKDGETESTPAGKRSSDTIKAGERLIEAIHLADAELEVLKDYQIRLDKAEENLDSSTRQKRKEIRNLYPVGKIPEDSQHKELFKPLLPQPQPNMLLLGRSPIKHVLYTLRSIRSQDLEEALLVLPYNIVERLFWYLLQLIGSNLQLELCCNCVLIMLRLHHNQIIANRSLVKEMDEVWLNMRSQIKKQKNSIGFNIAGLGFLKRQLEQDKIAVFDENESGNKKIKNV